MEKDLLTALIPTRVSAVSEVKSFLYWRKRLMKERFFIAETFFNFPAAAAGTTPGRSRTRLKQGSVYLYMKRYFINSFSAALQQFA
jgi:hypothetical protein